MVKQMADEGACCDNESETNIKVKSDGRDSIFPRSSLNQVDLEFYLQTYQRLKKTYAAKLKKNWTEKTDPDKFIHEDVGITSYLLALWKNLGLDKGPDNRPDFIDIGCGNGLLTFLLSREGFSGFGFDVRERKIWKCFEPEPRLIVSSFNPNDSQILENSTRNTWLIGNHPDELTPWIPVLARKYNCNFILIPCCAYDFVGKFKRESSKEGTSVYLSYLHYIKNLASNQCGFQVKIDKLRIPSTKRICLIGTSNDDHNDDTDHSSESSRLAVEFCNETIKKYNSEAAEKFEPRNAIEPVRNCTQIDRSILDKTVKVLFDYLVSDLEEKNNVVIEQFPGSPEKFCKVVWNAGRQDVTIKSAISQVPKEYLKEMKAQHGGFQTLIRNHSFIFKIVDGCVRLKQPQWDDIDKVDPSRIRRRRCYLQDNHPNRCPLPTEMCRFIH